MFKTIRSILRSYKERNKVFRRPYSAKPAAKSFYALAIKTIDGKRLIDFSAFKQKNVLLINTASRCGYTPQYSDWERFYQEHGGDVIVIGFPANDFLSQEPANASEIEAFCKKNYGVSFILTEKISVQGKHKHPVYQWLSDASLNGWNSREPSWNFCKYLINGHGELTHYFGSAIRPNTVAFKKAIEL